MGQLRIEKVPMKSGAILSSMMIKKSYIGRTLIVTACAFSEQWERFSRKKAINDWKLEVLQRTGQRVAPINWRHRPKAAICKLATILVKQVYNGPRTKIRDRSMEAVKSEVLCDITSVRLSERVSKLKRVSKNLSNRRDLSSVIAFKIFFKIERARSMVQTSGIPSDQRLTR